MLAILYSYSFYNKLNWKGRVPLLLNSARKYDFVNIGLVNLFSVALILLCKILSDLDYFTLNNYNKAITIFTLNERILI